jgi:hypothetical protein
MGELEKANFNPVAGLQLLSPTEAGPSTHKYFASQKLIFTARK